MHSLAFGNAMLAAAEDYKQVDTSSAVTQVWRTCYSKGACRSSTCSSLLFSHELQEVLGAERTGGSSSCPEVDFDALLDDPELELMHKERLYAMQKEAEKRAALQRKGHGELQTVEEGDFLQVLHSEATLNKMIAEHTGYQFSCNTPASNATQLIFFADSNRSEALCVPFLPFQL